MNVDERGLEDPDDGTERAVDAGAFCRDVEAYLCRRNEGHLVRIVGPSFDMVCGWAQRGIPLRIVCRGIDRCVERQAAKGGRRRPLRVEFCEADVLDVFDQWRKAVGVAPAAAGTPRVRTDSLPAHLDRAIARLTALRGGDDRGLHAAIGAVVTELDGMRAGASRLRGGDRQHAIDRLTQLEAMLVDTALGACDAQTRAALLTEAQAELAPFKARMAADTHASSVDACLRRLVRERFSLPVLALDRP